MKSFKYIIPAAILTGMFLSSCVKDLDVTPLTTTTVTSATAWDSDTSADCIVAKIYSTFAIPGQSGPGNDGVDIVGADQGEASFTRSYWNLEELTTDEAKVAWSDEALNGLQYCNWGPANRFIMLNYDRLYITIAYCNEFLNQTTDNKLSVSDSRLKEIHTLRAEVRTLRALSYYILLNFYGNVPFTDENSGIGAYLPEQKDRSFLFSWVENELKSVIDSNELPTKSAANYGTVNKYVAEMILANLYMNAEVYNQGSHYDEAASVLEDIIDNGGYSLEGNYAYNFQADNNLSPEIIFPIVYDGIYAQSYGGTLYLTAGAYDADMNPGADLGIAGSWDGIRAPQDLSQIFESGDSRAMFFKTDREQVIADNNNFKQGWSVVKYTNLKRDGSKASSADFPDTDFPFYRLADAYLLYVEASLHGSGDKAKAVGLYNQIQERAFGDKSHNIGSLSEITLDQLLEERSRELYWEGHRRTDLIRFGKYLTKSWAFKGGNANGISNIDSKYLLFPLPSTDVSANSNLKQNEGF